MEKHRLGSLYFSLFSLNTGSRYFSLNKHVNKNLAGKGDAILTAPFRGLV